jgi:hypothetical protein
LQDREVGGFVAGSHVLPLQVTDWVCVPPPQVAEHAPQPPSIQPHACGLQAWLEAGFVAGSQYAPLHVTERVCVPPPHVAEHAPQEPVTHAHAGPGFECDTHA